MTLRSQFGVSEVLEPIANVRPAGVADADSAGSEPVADRFEVASSSASGDGIDARVQTIETPPGTPRHQGGGHIEVPPLPRPRVNLGGIGVEKYGSVSDGLKLLNECLYPSGFASLVLGKRLYDWQVEVVDSLSCVGSRVALRTCNESGKTSEVLCLLVLWHMATFVESTTVTTAGVYRQIVQQLYPSLRRSVKALPDHEQWHFGRDSGRSPSGSMLYSFSSADAESAEGYHDSAASGTYGDLGVNPLSEFGITDEQMSEVSAGRRSLLIIADEAKSIDRGIFHAFERCHPTRMIIASSPGMTEGYFYDAFTIAKHRWRCFHADARMCPHLWDDPSRRAELEEQLNSLPASLTDSMIWGNFSYHADGSSLVMDPERVVRAMSGLNPRFGQGERRGAIDLSAGGDEQVFYVRDGNEAILAGAWREKDDHKLVENIIRCAEQWFLRPEHIYADGGGLGIPILNELDRRGWALNRINFGSPAREKRYYLNVRAEMYFTFANRLRMNEVRLPNDDILRHQLTFQRYIPSDGLLRLVPKQQLPESPDRADAIVMLWYDAPKASEYRERKRQLDYTASRTMTGPDSEVFRKNHTGVEAGQSSTGLWDV